MKNKYVIPMPARGFISRFMNYMNKNSKDVSIYSTKKSFEKVTNRKKILHRIINCKIFDLLGVFQIIKYNQNEESAAISFNRFLRTNKPYYIILENPYALTNYADNRAKYTITKKS